MDRMLLLPTSTRDALVAYLSERPFKEVAQGIRALQDLEALAAPEEQRRTVDQPK